ncbi:MAG TPA: tetratricopeptide repeat protein [Candidatus Sulfotelmatobacter sp.]|nr:tetratricopeptide repeat protein [Candidatus Sulfotelmatobacter sp.]
MKRRFGRDPGDEEKKKAAEWFQQSITADRNFAPAYVGLANAYSRIWASERDEATEFAAAEKAVALDPKSADARIALGDANWKAGRWMEAEQQFRMAVAFNPNNADSHANLCNILEVTGRLDEGLKEAEIAQSFDPAHDHLSWSLYRARHYDRAIEIGRRFTESHPEDIGAHWSLAQNYFQKQMTSQWVGELDVFMTSSGFSEVGGHLRQAAASGGYPAALRQWTKELEHLSSTRKLYWPGVLAQAYAMLGDKERAFYWLEHAYTHRLQSHYDPYLWGGLTITPGFDSLWSDPRYHDLLHRLRLPD